MQKPYLYFGAETYVIGNAETTPMTVSSRNHDTVSIKNKHDFDISFRTGYSSPDLIQIYSIFQKTKHADGRIKPPHYSFTLHPANN
jgi:hypothetical protein